jgi:hypothetical protein
MGAGDFHAPIWSGPLLVDFRNNRQRRQRIDLPQSEHVPNESGDKQQQNNPLHGVSFRYFKFPFIIAGGRMRVVRCAQSGHAAVHHGRQWGSFPARNWLARRDELAHRQFIARHGGSPRKNLEIEFFRFSFFSHFFLVLFLTLANVKLELQIGATTRITYPVSLSFSESRRDSANSNETPAV